MEKTLAANLRSVVKKHIWKILFSVFLLTLSNMLLVINPLILRKAIAYIQEGSSFLPWSCILIAIAFVSSILKYYMRLGFFYVGKEVEQEIRSKLFKKIQSQSMAFFDNHGTGELLSRLTSDITAYRDVLGPGIMFPMFFITIVIPALGILFYLSTPLACLSLIPLVAVPLFNQFIRKSVFSLSLRVQKIIADLSNMTQEHYSGIRTIKGYVIENKVYSLFLTLCQELKHYNYRLVSLLGMIFPFFTLLTRLVTVGLVVLSAYIIVKAWGELTPGDFVAFMWIQSYIFFPILMLGWVLPIYARGGAAYQRLFEIYEEPIELEEGRHKELLVTSQSDITFKNLSFCYPQGSSLALEGINLTIKAGSFVGITGPVGGGKTTLFRLLNREYEIPRGHIYIGNYDIRDYTLANLREGMVTVEQAPFLFSKTIADNVRFGKEEATQMELERVSSFAELHETIMSFPEKYETLIGERGVTLSGGQKQRVALARAFLVNRPILLLDDVFSALDISTEKKVFESLQKHFRNKTLVLITHRASILENMDRVIYMHGGKIAEDGSPETLKQQGGYFAALVDLQKFGT